MNAGVEKAVEYIARTVGHYSDIREKWGTVTQALRDQHTEIARLRKIEEERWSVVATRNAAVMRAEKAEALLREWASATYERVYGGSHD